MAEEKKVSPRNPGQKKKKRLIDQLNPFYNCKRYNIPIWQCPSFLFVLMGLFIIFAILTTYFVASRNIGDPRLVSLIVIGVTFILLIIDFIITKSFERVSEASIMKTEFISIVSHQLRTPLTNIKYSMEILEKNCEEKFSKKDKEFFGIIEENIKRMGGLVNNLLTVSRIETGRAPLNIKTIDIRKITQEVIKKHRPRADSEGTTIKAKIPASIPKIKGDDFWTEQILGNLIDNAIRYTPDHKGSAEISIKKKKTGILCEVKDNGVGIPETEQKFIFRKFFRSKNVLRKQTQGSGLGLYIAREMILNMGGQIWFRSKEGKGTSFYFFLPYAKK